MLVLYGSQTGSAEEVAERVARGLRRRRVGSVTVSALDAFDRQLLAHASLAVFVVATTGDGDPPDNMRRFWRFLLRKELPRDVLEQLEFAVFGCGDSSYEKYNVMARKLRARLLQLGAKEFAERGFGDDQSRFGLEGDLDAWLPKLWEGVVKKFSLPSDFIVDESPRLFDPRNKQVEVVSNASVTPNERWTQLKQSVIERKPAGTYGGLIEAELICNKRITEASWEQDTRHIELKMSDTSAIDYEAGDIAVIFPENIIEEKKLEALLSRLGYPALDATVRVELPHVPRKVSMRELFTKYLDFLGTPRRRFFEALSFFTENEEEKEKAEELCSAEGNDLFHAYCKKERKSYLEVLEDFSNVKPPLNYLVEMIPLLQPREYSISSSPRAHGNKIHLTIAFLEYLTPWGRKNIGIASRWWRSLSTGSHTLMFIKKGSLKMPPPEVSLILIGPGTGVAPMRSLIYERQLPNVHLYFGCRSKLKDDYYRDEWNTLLQSRKLGSVRTAYSRDDPKRKIYVQNLVDEDQERLADLILNNGAAVYISGSAKRMPNDVKEALIAALETRLSSKEEAQAYIQRMESRNKFKIEAWS